MKHVNEIIDYPVVYVLKQLIGSDGLLAIRNNSKDKFNINSLKTVEWFNNVCNIAITFTENKRVVSYIMHKVVESKDYEITMGKVLANLFLELIAPETALEQHFCDLVYGFMHSLNEKKHHKLTNIIEKYEYDRKMLEFNNETGTATTKLYSTALENKYFTLLEEFLKNVLKTIGQKDKT